MTIGKIVEFDGTGIDLKAVQVTTDDGSYLVLGYRKHGALLDAFLEYKEIPFRPMRLQDDEIHARTRNIPGFKPYELVGAGIAKRINDICYLSGHSIGYYGLTPNEEHAKRFNEEAKKTVIEVLNNSKHNHL